MKPKVLFSRWIVIGLILACLSAGQAQVELAAGFASPPDSAKPYTWWHWMNGMITAEGITLDLEAMKEAGLGGAQLFNVTDGIPEGPVDFASPEWFDLVEHAVEVADRLGLKLTIHNCAGWSSSGGPWITPDLAMKIVVTSEIHVKGPQHFQGVLPKPFARRGYYRDIAVVAFPTPPAALAGRAALDTTAKVTSSLANFNPQVLLDGNPDTAVGFTCGSQRADWVQFAFDKPFTARSLQVTTSAAGTFELQSSQDGVHFSLVKRFGTRRPDIIRVPVTVVFKPTTARYFRLLGTGERARRLGLAEVELNAGWRLPDWAAKAGYQRRDRTAPYQGKAPEGTAVQSSKLRQLKSVDITGRLDWQVPPGDWTIMRVGYTLTGKENHPAPAAGRGLECDKLSREAVDFHFEALMGKLLKRAGPHTPRALDSVLVDSYEVGCQNWTQKMPAEFKRLRGYDLLPYLPVFSGRVVDSVETTERFLWDFRRTLADLYAENYFGRFAELAHQHGLLFYTEPYGNGNFDDLQSGGKADIPMSEFWVGQGHTDSKVATSIAHTYGRKFVGAESFTASENQAGWRNYPFRLKSQGDAMFCYGINRFIFHRYAHQPWVDLVPGMTMGPHGFHFDRTITWWPEAHAWLSYLSRCQFMLQQGLPVSDVLYFVGENSPNSMPAVQHVQGYDYDACDTYVLLHRLSVENGRLVLPEGTSYRLLVLPPARAMTPEIARRVAELVQAGATVLGPPPERSPSLSGGPDADQVVQAIAREVWGNCDGKRLFVHKYGKGRVIYGKSVHEALELLEVAPDFTYEGVGFLASLDYIHRKVGPADVYFVSNQLNHEVVVRCAFRVKNKLPELWHPDTGKRELAPVWQKAGDRTEVTLRLAPAGSVFVVFERPAKTPGGITSYTRNGKSLLTLAPKGKHTLKIIKAEYGLLSNNLPGCVDVTEQVRRLVNHNRLMVTASNELAGDPAHNIVKQLVVEYTLDGKRASAKVAEGQVLELPPAGRQGKLVILRAVYGDLPEKLPPKGAHTVDVTRQLQAKVTPQGTLMVLASNALAGDPVPLVVKQLRVEYELDGRRYTKVVKENSLLVLPPLNELHPEPAAAVVVEELEGKPRILAFKPGLYEVEFASGRKASRLLSQVPQPLALHGAWKVSFPPKLGAPPEVTFERLVSWTERPEEGVKYFSGTATYRKQFSVPAGDLEGGTRVVLDLGEVHELAQVKVNGQDFGVLWKPPFRVDITKAVKAGANMLEVQVTNLWPNRLIGDERLPDDAQWQGKALKRWPEWLLKGELRPKTGRITFTTWKHWHASSPLLKSGLLGPVRLYFGRTAEL